MDFDQEGNVWASEPSVLPKEWKGVQDLAQAPTEYIQSRGSRSTSINILDLPNEILIRVFASLGPLHTSTIELTPNPAATDIGSVRLTCRRFCALGSDLLLPTLLVEISPESLRRLEEVSQHPLIGHGVKTVCVVHKYFSPRLANNLPEFLFQRMKALMFAANRARVLLNRHPAWKTDALARQLTKLEAIRDAYNLLRRELPIPGSSEDDSSEESLDTPEALEPGISLLPLEEQVKYREILSDDHARYRKRWAAQKSLLSSGQFCRDVAGAMSRMPRATRLVMTDKDIWTLFGCKMGQRVDRKDLARFLADPLRMETVPWFEASQFDSLPTSLLTDLPAAIYEAGASITELSLDGFAPWSDPMLAPFADEDRCRPLACLSKKLVSFSFSTMDSVYRSFQDGLAVPVTVLGVFNTLKSFISSPALEELHLDCSVWSTHHNHFGDFGSTEPNAFDLLFLGPKWPCIRNVELSGIPFDIAHLEAFLDRIDGENLQSVRFERMRLDIGTWEEVLDRLRDRFKDRQDVFVFLKLLYGAEADSLSTRRSEWLYQVNRTAGLGKPHPKVPEGFTAFENYIRGGLEKNPFRDFPPFIDEQEPLGDGPDPDGAIFRGKPFL